MIAINDDYSFFKFASEVLRNDLDFIHEVYNLNSNIIKYIDYNLLKHIMICKNYLKIIKIKNPRL
jgi:hypothetical protein